MLLESSAAQIKALYAALSNGEQYDHESWRQISPCNQAWLLQRLLMAVAYILPLLSHDAAL